MGLHKKELILFRYVWISKVVVLVGLKFQEYYSMNCWEISVL